MKRVILTLTVIAALVGCDKPAEQKPADPAAKENTPAPTVASTIDDKDLATPADFEEEAEKAIDATNYKKELATLEEQISKE